MAFIELTKEELEDLKILSQYSVYFNKKTGDIDSTRGFKYVEEVINPTKTQFIKKYEDASKSITEIYAIMNKTIYTGTEYTNLSNVYSSYKLYKRV